MRHSKPSVLFLLQVFGWQDNLSDRLRFHKVMGHSHIVISAHFYQNIFSLQYVCLLSHIGHSKSYVNLFSSLTGKRRFPHWETLSALTPGF
jgi:hypothetical protein